MAKKPQVVNLSKETMDQIAPALQSMRDSLRNQTRLLSDTFKLQQTSIQDGERRAALQQSSLLTPETATSSISSESSSEAAAKAGGGLGIGGIFGKAMSGFGIGGGALMAGAGILLMGGGQILEQLANFDGKKIRANVGELLAIQDDFGSAGTFFAKGGTFVGTMTMIGAGLGAFSIGAGAAIALDKWEGDGKWVDNIKTNVDNLLGLADSDAVTIKNVAGFSSTMLAMGLGLAAFAPGAAILSKFADSTTWATNTSANVETLLGTDVQSTSAGDIADFAGTMGGLSLGLIAFLPGAAAGAAVGTFSKTLWASDIKDNVEKLLEIPDLKNASWAGTGSFLRTMFGLSAGLAAFALGKGLEGTAEVGQEGLSYFTDQAGWAERVKTEVKTLLSIASLKGVGSDTAGFVTTMGGLSLGLAAFALGKGVEGGATAFQGILSKFTGTEPFADRIKSEVDTLLGITSTNKNDGAMFNTAMGNISKGLLKFSGGEFGASFVGVGSSILNFLSGDKSPITKIKEIADNADQLTKGATAIGSIADNLNKFQSITFDGGKFDIKSFADDLLEAVPIIEGAVMGSPGGYLWGKEIKGLASPEIDYEAARQNIFKLRDIMGLDARGSVPSAANEDATVNKASNIAVGPTTIINKAGDVYNGGNKTDVINNVLKPGSLATSQGGFSN